MKNDKLSLSKERRSESHQKRKRVERCESGRSRTEAASVILRSIYASFPFPHRSLNLRAHVRKGLRSLPEHLCETSFFGEGASTPPSFALSAPSLNKKKRSSTHTQEATTEERQAVQLPRKMMLRAGIVRRRLVASSRRGCRRSLSSSTQEEKNERRQQTSFTFEADPTLAARPVISSPLASLRMANTEPSVFAEFSELSEKFHAVNLGQGYPDFAMPDFVKEAAVEAIHGDYNQYSRPAGHTRLVRTLAARYSPRLGRSLNAAEEICVVGGATNAIFSAVVALVDPDDEVVCVEPFFDAPKIAADLMGAKTIGVPLRADWARTSADWKLDLSELEAALTEKTKLLVLNTPHNPTGKVFSVDELDGIASIVERFPNLVVLSDEVYEAMVYDDLEHVHFASRPGMFDRTLTVFSAGKTFSATGWRVGYVIGPRQLISPLVRVHQASNFSTPTPLQVATAIAFERCEKMDYYATFKATLQAKRDKLCKLLRVAGLAPIVPEGGYFLLADTTKVALSTQFPLWEAPEDIPLRERRDFAVCRLLCERAGVTAIPASAFFSQGHRHITDSLARFCFCKEDDTLDEAFRRIVHSGLGANWV